MADVEKAECHSSLPSKGIVAKLRRDPRVCIQLTQPSLAEEGGLDIFNRRLTYLWLGRVDIKATHACLKDTVVSAEVLRGLGL